MIFYDIQSSLKHKGNYNSATFFLIFVRMENVHKLIEYSVLRRKKGALIFPTHFTGGGTQTAVKTKPVSNIRTHLSLHRKAFKIKYHDRLVKIN